jgi:enterochelin esterase-like enzyme
VVSLARAARKTQPALALRIATSNDDAFVNTNRALAEALSSAGVPREFEDHLGPHDYIWNRGPGSFELLLFHDHALGG